MSEPKISDKGRSIGEMMDLAKDDNVASICEHIHQFSRGDLRSLVGHVTAVFCALMAAVPKRERLQVIEGAIEVARSWASSEECEYSHNENFVIRDERSYAEKAN